MNVEGFIKRIPAVRVLTIEVFDKSNGAEECIYSSSSSSYPSDGYPYLCGSQQPTPINTSINNGSSTSINNGSRKPYLEKEDAASNSRVYSFDCFEISGLAHTQIYTHNIFSVGYIAYVFIFYSILLII